MFRLGLLVLCLEIFTSTALAQARVVSGGGKIEVIRQNSATPAIPNQPLIVKDHVRSGNGSFATIELAPGNRVVLGEQTEVELRSSQGNMRVSLERGGIQVFSNTQIVVLTKDGEFTSAGGGLEMDLNYKDGKLTLAIAKGSISPTGLTSNVVFAATGNASTNRTLVAGGRRHESSFPLASCIGSSDLVPYAVYVSPNAFVPIAPGYSPSQVVPPIADPLRPPVHYPANPFPNGSRD